MADPKPHMVNGSRQYMSKAQRPCDFCRVRKTACRIQAGPPCRMCVLHSRACTFGDASVTQLPRPRSPGNRLATTPVVLEPWAVFGELQENRPNPPPEGHPANHPTMHPAAPREGSHEWSSWEQFSPTVFGFGTPGPSSFAGDGGNELDMASIPNAAFDAVTVEAELPDTLLGSDGMESTPQFIGTTGEFEPHLVRHYFRDAGGRMRFKKLTLQFVQPGVVPSHFWFMSQSVYSQSRQEAGLQRISEKPEERSKLESIVPTSVGYRLIRLFDRFIAPHYPIFSNQCRPSPESSPIYLLAAIYAITNHYTQYDDSLTLDFAYEDDLYAELSRTARRTIESELHAPTFPVVQALILMLIQPATHHFNSESSLKRTILGMLISAAHALGLHTDPGPWPIARWQITQRRRVSFIIFSLDTWISCAFGSPPLVSEQNWLVDALSIEDMFDSGLSPARWAELLHQSRLTSILRKVLGKLHSLRAIANSARDTSETFSIARQLQDELQTWRENILHHDNPTGSMAAINLVGYYYAHVNICRALLSSTVANERLLVPATSPSGREFECYARRVTKQCLVGAMQFLLQIEQDPEETFWPVWAPVAFASFVNLMWLMLVTSTDFDEATEWIKMLSKSRNDLRTRSKQLQVLRLALLRMDALFWRGVELTFHLENHVAAAVAAFYQELDV